MWRGKTSSSDYRSAEGKIDRLSALPAEFVRLNVDVIVARASQLCFHCSQERDYNDPYYHDDSHRCCTYRIRRKPSASCSKCHRDDRHHARNLLANNWSYSRKPCQKSRAWRSLEILTFRTHMAYSKEAERAAKIIGIKIQFAEMQAPTTKT